jgi:hypothetical protein
MQSAGLTRRHDEDGRVLLAGRATLWGRFTLASVYLHEVAHALCFKLSDSQKIDSHGPIFCLILSCLYSRASMVPHLSGLPASISFYDFSDCPRELEDVHDWRAEIVRFLNTECRKLANSSCSAEALAIGAQTAWSDFLNARSAKIKDWDRSKKIIAELTLKNSNLSSDLAEAKRFFIPLLLIALGGWGCAILFVLTMNPLR